MATNFTRSVDRAAVLLNTPNDYENYLSFKIKGESGCYCSGCCSRAWDIINEYIYPCGPIGHEGDALINTNGMNYVLEQHESGPEIVIYLGLATASISFITAVIGLATVLVQALQDKSKNGFIKIINRYQINGTVTEEILEIEAPVSEDTIKKLGDVIKTSIETRKPDR